MDDDLQKRLRGLEDDFLKIETTARISLIWGGIFGLVIIAWLGITTFYSIPKAATDALKSEGATAVIDRLQQLRFVAEKNADAIATLSIAGKTISVSGQCFKPRTVYRCFKGPDHMTWFDNEEECTKAQYRVEDRVVVLGNC